MSKTPHQLAVSQVEVLSWFGAGALQHFPSSSKYIWSLLPWLLFLNSPFTYFVRSQSTQPLESKPPHQYAIRHWPRQVSNSKENKTANTIRRMIGEVLSQSSWNKMIAVRKSKRQGVISYHGQTSPTNLWDLTIFSRLYLFHSWIVKIEKNIIYNVPSQEFFLVHSVTVLTAPRIRKKRG